MRPKSLFLLALALGCGLVASIGITQVMDNRDAEQNVPTGDTETVFVALEDIGLGDILESQLLRLEPWPKDKVPEGALTKIEDVEGRRTKARLYAGEPILENKLFPKGASGMSATVRIPKGYRVIPVRVDSVSGASGMILPGDRVDVVLFVPENRCSGAIESGVHTILQDIKVFACNDVVEPDTTEGSSKSIKAQTISLLVPPDQAKKVVLATELGKIQLVMRSPEDAEHIVDDPTTPADLFGRSESADRDKDSPGEKRESGDGAGKNFRDFLQSFRAGTLAAKAKAPTDGQPERHTMTIVSGPDVQQVVLEPEGDPSSGRWKQVMEQGIQAPVAQAQSLPDLYVPGAEPGQTPSPEKEPQQVGDDS